MTCFKPFLTLCMIVKNEEKNLPRSLNSIKDLVDEIIIVDTGSEDKTLEIARQFGANVSSFPWQNDFSQARNYALEQAHGEWILFLDADEELGKIELDLKGVLYNSKAEGYFLKIVNLKDNQDVLNSPSFRLFRNNHLYRYEGKIHEQILPCIQKKKPNGTIEWLDIEIYHYGYLEEEIRSKNKVERNLEILLSQPPEVMNLPFFCLNLGMEYLRITKLAEAEACFKEGWEKSDTNVSYAHRLILNLILTLFLQKKYAESIKYCEEGQKNYPDYADLYYYHGAALMEQGKFKEARQILLKGLEKGPSPAHYISEGGCGSYLNLEALGSIEEIQLNFNLAVEYFLQAFQQQPDNFYYLKLFLKNLVKSDFNQSDIIKELVLDEEALHVGGKFLFNLGRYGFAKELLDRINNKDPLDFSMELLYAKCLFMLNELNHALELFKIAAERDENKEEAVLYIWLVALLQNDINSAQNSLVEMETAERKTSNFLRQLHNYLTSDFPQHCRVDAIDTERYLNLLLIVIEAFAGVGGNCPLLARSVAFAGEVFDSKVLIMIGKILYKQKLNAQSLKIFSSNNLQFFDTEAFLAYADLLSQDKPLMSVKILYWLIQQNNLFTPRIYLMAVDTCLRTAGEMNQQLGRKVKSLARIPPIC
ncbi:MAG: tetratricopeptide repeat-containing glycosyltransferase family 2 protein [Bacillota bacterium]